MFWKKSIKAKLLTGILIPAIIVFLIAGLFTIYLVQKAITTTMSAELAALSQVASNQVNSYFTKYSEVVSQMENNATIQQMLKDSKEPGKSKELDSYAAVAKTMDNIIDLDENISLVWSADFTSGDSVRSGGAFRCLPDYDITTRDWYEDMSVKQAPFMSTYQDSTTGAFVASILEPVYENGKIAGCTAIDITVDQITTMMANYKLGETGFCVLITDLGIVAYHPNSEYIGKDITECNFSQNVIDAVKARENTLLSYENSSEKTEGYLANVGSTNWLVLSGLPFEEFNADFDTIKDSIFFVFMGGIVLLFAVIFLISGGIVKPLVRLKKSANSIADGDLDVEMDLSSLDEAGQVAHAINRTVLRLKDYIAYINEIAATLDEIAAGNLNCSLELEYKGEFEKIKVALENILTNLSTTIKNIIISSEQVSSGSEQVSSGAQALSQGTTQQASSIQELSATISEISQQVKSTAINAVSARDKAQIAANEVSDSNGRMRQMSEAMDAISVKSEQISKIIKTIEDIAFQTNILALNAAVEAARAGAAGKGFAVVADEVRNLAGKSAEAAKNTTALIGETVQAVSNGTKIAQDTVSSMLGVVNGVSAVTDLITEISSASDEQANAITQVTLGVEQISAVVQTNSATAEQSAAASEELSAQAVNLKHLVEQFKL